MMYPKHYATWPEPCSETTDVSERAHQVLGQKGLDPMALTCTESSGSSQGLGFGSGALGLGLGFSG